jgi:hypothetical protein
VALLNEQSMPSFERPILGNIMPNDEKKLAQLNCKEEIIKWLISVLLIEIQPTNQLSTSTSTSGINVTNSTSFTGSSSVSEYGSTSTIGTLSNTMWVWILLLCANSERNNYFGDFFFRKANNQDEFNDFESSLFDFPSSVSSFMNASQSTSSISSTSTITNVTSNTNGLTNINKNLIQKVILSSTSNVNLIHEILRNVSLTFQRQ